MLNPVAEHHGTLAEVTLAGPVELLVAKSTPWRPHTASSTVRGRDYFTAGAVTRDEREPVGEAA